MSLAEIQERRSFRLNKERTPSELRKITERSPSEARGLILVK